VQKLMTLNDQFHILLYVVCLYMHVLRQNSSSGNRKVFSKKESHASSLNGKFCDEILRGTPHVGRPNESHNFLREIMGHN